MFDPTLAKLSDDSPSTAAYVGLVLMAVGTVLTLIATVWMSRNFTPWILGKFLATDGALERLRGQTGRATTLLNPAGKARFGGLEIRVRAVDVLDIDPGLPVEVVDVQGDRVMVRRALGVPPGAIDR